MLVVEGDIDPSGLRAVESLIASGVCASADYCQTTESTNTQALSDLRHGLIDQTLLPKCYLTDQQTAGRGRHGRRWMSDRGTLTFSLVLDRAAIDRRRSQLLSIAVGVGIARVIEFEFAPLQAKLKWPNDVHIGGGKVAGVLLENIADSPQQVVVGVGVNVATEPSVEPGQAGFITRSLAQVVGRDVRRYEIFSPLVSGIMEAIVELRDSADELIDELIDEFRNRCLLSGQKISFQQRGKECQGICCGISSSGELMVETDAGTQFVQSGEARLVRVAKD